MRNTSIALVGILSAAALTLAGGDVEKTQSGSVQMPKYEVTKKQEGEVKLPSYDVKTPDVNVTTTEKQITVPTVDINTRKETVTVPSVSVTPAPDRDDRKSTTSNR